MYGNRYRIRYREKGAAVNQHEVHVEVVEPKYPLLALCIYIQVRKQRLYIYIYANNSFSTFLTNI